MSKETGSESQLTFRVLSEFKKKFFIYSATEPKDIRLWNDIQKKVEDVTGIHTSELIIYVGGMPIDAQKINPSNILQVLFGDKGGEVRNKNPKCHFIACVNGCGRGKDYLPFLLKFHHIVSASEPVEEMEVQGEQENSGLPPYLLHRPQEGHTYKFSLCDYAPEKQKQHNFKFFNHDHNHSLRFLEMFRKLKEMNHHREKKEKLEGLDGFKLLNKCLKMVLDKFRKEKVCKLNENYILYCADGKFDVEQYRVKKDAYFDDLCDRIEELVEMSLILKILIFTRSIDTMEFFVRIQKDLKRFFPKDLSKSSVFVKPILWSDYKDLSEEIHSHHSMPFVIGVPKDGPWAGTEKEESTVKRND